MPHLFVVCPQAGPIESGHTARQEAETGVLKRERRSVVDALCPVADCAIEGNHAAHASQNESGDEQLLRGNLAELANFQWRASDGLGVFPKGEPRIAEIAFEARPKLFTEDPWSRKQQEQDNHGNPQSPTVEPFCILGTPRFLHFAPLSTAAARACGDALASVHRSQDQRPTEPKPGSVSNARPKSHVMGGYSASSSAKRSPMRSHRRLAARRELRVTLSGRDSWAFLAVTLALPRYSKSRSKSADSWLIGPRAP